MPDARKNSNPAIGDLPTRKQIVRADQGSENEPSTATMIDPFTDQATHSAGDGQGANAFQPKRPDRKQRQDDGSDEETMPIEEGFSPVP